MRVNPHDGLYDERAVNSAGECYLHTVEVTGSNPVPPTRFDFNRAAGDEGKSVGIPQWE